MAKLFSVISAVLALLDFAASYVIVRAIASVVVRYDPHETVRVAYTMRLWEQVGAILVGLFWLSAIIFLGHYYETARTKRTLLRRAATVIPIQLALIGAAWAVPYLLYLL